MDTPTLKARILELEKETRPYNEGKLSMDAKTMSFHDVLSWPKLYIVVPIVIACFLILFSPPFIMYETKDKKLKVSYKKLFVYWLLITTALLVGIFGYNYKNKPK